MSLLVTPPCPPIKYLHPEFKAFPASAISASIAAKEDTCK
jgi:hypothetical protein